MNLTPSDIVITYFEALSSANVTTLSEFLWDDFKTIGPGFEINDKETFLQNLKSHHPGGQSERQKILALDAVGNIVRVKHSPNGLAQSQQRVFAIVDHKIKLEVHL